MSLVGLLFAGIAFGQTITDTAVSDAQAIQQAESISTSDLGVSNLGLLPTNPFYFFKELSRNVKRVFTFNPVAKARLEVKIANEKVAEAKKIQEIAPNNNNAIAKGVKNYQAAQERVNLSLESLKITASTTPEFEKLMNSFAIDVVSHQKVLDEIGIKASDSVDVKNAVDSAKLKIDESAATAIQDNPTDFVNKLQNALIDSKGSELKHMRSVEIITNIEARAPEAAKPALLKVQENLANKLNESIQQVTDASGSAVVRQLIKEIPSSDSVQRAATVKQLPQKVFVPSVKSTGGAGGSAVQIAIPTVFICDQLKVSLEKLTAELKAGNLTEEQYNLKYESIKKELERCSSQPVSTGTTKPVEGVYCAQEAKLCSDGSYVGRAGSNCEFTKCSGESSGPIIKSFGSAYWQCYDGKESKDSSSCKTSEEWQIEAKKFCDGRCYADKSKCGVNSFSVSGECGAVLPTLSVSGSTGTVIKEECGKESEKVNRDPLVGPVTKQCCYGLKEDRSNKAYSICIKPLETTSDTTTSISATDSSAAGGSSGVIPLLKTTTISPMLPTISSDGGSGSAVPSTSNTSGY